MRPAAIETVDEYIAGFPPAVRRLLRRVRETIREAAPAAAEGLAYRMPAYRLNGVLVYFAGHQRHIGFYPGARGIAAFEGELDAYVHAKGSVQFQLDEPIPFDLIARIVALRARENLEKERRRPGRAAALAGKERSKRSR